MKLSPELLAKIREGDLNANRVAADALLEHGDERAQAVVDGVTIALRPNPATCREIASRASTRTMPEALRALGVREARQRRGFIDEVTVAEAAIDQLPAMLELEPIRGLRVEVENGVKLAKVMSSSVFSAITRLTVTNGEALLLSLGSPVPGLLEFTSRTPLRYNEKLLAMMPALQSLYVSSPPDDEWLQLAPSLKRLSLPGAQLSHENIAVLARSTAPLEYLNLGLPRVGGSAAILRSTTLKNLHTFWVGDELRPPLSVVRARDIVLPALRALRGLGRISAADRDTLAARRIRAS